MIPCGVRYAQPIVNELRANMVRVDSDFSATPSNTDKSRAGAKISNAELDQCFPPPHVVGYGRSSAVAIPQGGTGAVSVRLHHGGPQGAKPKGEVVADVLQSIKERKAYSRFKQTGRRFVACGSVLFFDRLAAQHHGDCTR